MVSSREHFSRFMYPAVGFGSLALSSQFTDDLCAVSNSPKFLSLGVGLAYKLHGMESGPSNKLTVGLYASLICARFTIRCRVI